jgi:hypothetical protein
MYLTNKYTHWYYSIIDNAKTRETNISAYYETHHIVPRSIGGNDSADNLVNLTAREHYICHALLPRMLTGANKQKMLFAYNMMCICKSGNQNRDYKINSKIFEAYKTQRKHTDETKIKLSQSHKGLKQTAETIEKRVSKFRGKESKIKGKKTHSDESKLKIANAVKLRYKLMSAEERSELAKTTFSSPESWTAKRKDKISKKLTGIVRSEETRNKMSQSKKTILNNMTPEEKKKYGDAHRGKPWSPARRAAYNLKKGK